MWGATVSRAAASRRVFTMPMLKPPRPKFRFEVFSEMRDGRRLYHWRIVRHDGEEMARSNPDWKCFRQEQCRTNAEIVLVALMRSPAIVYVAANAGEE